MLAFTPLGLSIDTPVIDPLSEEVRYWRRHERNSAACRGQQYVAHCCEDARTDLACIDANLSKEQK